MDSLKTYRDFADADYAAASALLKGTECYSIVASLGVQAIEKYLKHIIDVSEHFTTEDKRQYLHSHNLKKLHVKASEVMPLSITYKECHELSGIYFASRYPGDDEYIPNKEEAKIILAVAEKIREDAHRDNFSVKPPQYDKIKLDAVRALLPDAIRDIYTDEEIIQKFHNLLDLGKS